MLAPRHPALSYSSLKSKIPMPGGNSNSERAERLLMACRQVGAQQRCALLFVKF